MTTSATSTTSTATDRTATDASKRPSRLGRAFRRSERSSRPHTMARLAALTAGLLTVGTTLGVLAPMAASAATQNNCAASPSACGYPDATNTGVPAGTTLKTVGTQVTSGPGWTYSATTGVQVTGNGAVLSGLYIPNSVTVKASNVTIQNCDVVTNGQSSIGIQLRHTSNVTIQNSTISGTDNGNGRMMAGIKDVYGDSAGLQVMANNIYYTGTGFQGEQGLVQGNYIHAMGYIQGDHINGITSNGGVAGTLTIRHNTILVDHNQTDAVGLFEDFGVQANRVIDNNLLAGGSYAIYAGQNAGGATTSNIQVTNNRISNLYYANGGVYGPVTAYNHSGAGDTWSGNTWDATGATIASP
jgi:hypothetical protein